MYPRLKRIDGKQTLVSNEQMVGCHEHLAHSHRILLMEGPIGENSLVCNEIIALDSRSHKPIKIIINSPGGVLDTTFALYDTLKLLSSEVQTLGRFCASAAVILLAVGKRRYLLPHSKIMLHMPSGQMMGDAAEFEIQNTQMKDYQKRMVDILKECGAKKTTKEILKDLRSKREIWMNPKEAIEYGLADEIIDKKTMQGWLS